MEGGGPQSSLVLPGTNTQHLRHQRYFNNININFLSGIPGTESWVGWISISGCSLQPYLPGVHCSCLSTNDLCHHSGLFRAVNITVILRPGSVERVVGGKRFFFTILRNDLVVYSLYTPHATFTQIPAKFTLEIHFLFSAPRT